MDGTNVQTMKRLTPFQVKRLNLGSIVSIYDEESGDITECRLIKYGSEKRLQSLDRLHLYFRIKDNPGLVYLVEGK